MRVPRYGFDGQVLSPEERRAIEGLERVAKNWPASLMLASMAGTLCVMRLDADGAEPSTADGGLDPAAQVETIGIPNTGGDW